MPGIRFWIAAIAIAVGLASSDDGFARTEVAATEVPHATGRPADRVESDGTNAQANVDALNSLMVLPQPNTPIPPEGITVIDGDTRFVIFSATKVFIETILVGDGAPHNHQYIVNPQNLDAIKSREGRSGDWDYFSTINSPASWYTALANVSNMSRDAGYKNKESHLIQLFEATQVKMTPKAAYTVATSVHNYKIEELGEDLIRIEYKTTVNGEYPEINKISTWSLIVNTKTLAAGIASSNASTGEGWRGSKDYRAVNAGSLTAYKRLLSTMVLMTRQARIESFSTGPREFYNAGLNYHSRLYQAYLAR